MIDCWRQSAGQMGMLSEITGQACNRVFQADGLSCEIKGSLPGKA